MKLIEKDTFPTCNICNEESAIYDAPTAARYWAYMCRSCFDLNGASYADSVGFRFVAVGTLPTRSEESIAQDLADAIWSGDFDLAEEIIGDRDLAEFL